MKPIFHSPGGFPSVYLLISLSPPIWSFLPLETSSASVSPSSHPLIQYPFPLECKFLKYRWRWCIRWCRSRPAGSALGCNIHIHTDYRNPVEEKGQRSHSLKRRAPLSAWATPSRGERPTLASTGFYCFSRPLTSKMALLCYAKACFG